jgi:hypothetical protein
VLSRFWRVHSRGGLCNNYSAIIRAIMTACPSRWTCIVVILALYIEVACPSCNLQFPGFVSPPSASTGRDHVKCPWSVCPRLRKIQPSYRPCPSILALSAGEYKLYRSQNLPLNGPTVIDVRSGQEFATSHIIGATNIPLDELDNRLFELPPPLEEPIHLYGETEQQLTGAREILEKYRCTYCR